MSEANTASSLDSGMGRGQVLRFSPDGKFIWTRNPNRQPVRIEQVDLKTGVHSRLLPDFGPRRAGGLNVSEGSPADDPRNYAYMERKSASYLFELKQSRE